MSRPKSSSPVPNEWYTRQMWRTLYPGEEVQATALRWSLYGEGVYPTADIVGNPRLAVYEANHRAALHQVVDELDRTDLVAVFNVARLFLLVPRRPDLFDWIAADQARVLAQLRLRSAA